MRAAIRDAMVYAAKAQNRPMIRRRKRKGPPTWQRSELWRGVLTIHTSRTNSCSNNPPHSHHENLHRTLDPQTQLVQWSLGLDPYSSMLQKPKHQQLSSGCSSSPQPTDELVEKSLNLILVIVSKRGVNMLKIQLILFWDVIMHYNLKLQSSKPCQKGVGADVDQW